LANAFSYWQGQTIQNASHSYLDDLNQAFSHIQTVAGTLDIEIWTGETGWPTDGGTNYESAMAGTQNAATFFQQGVCAALAWGFNVFYFEAFDEPSKPPSIGTNGESEDETHWGAFTADRVAKFSMSC
jgi:glucan 1,3-beta-glucosidase